MAARKTRNIGMYLAMIASAIYIYKSIKDNRTNSAKQKAALTSFVKTGGGGIFPH